MPLLGGFGGDIAVTPASQRSNIPGAMSMKRLERLAAGLQQKANVREEFTERIEARFAGWNGAFGLDPEACFFEGAETMPAFAGDLTAPTAADAWWLAELCRLVYTPDHRERNQEAYRNLPLREEILAARTPFEEVLSIHKTGNHASIYRLREGGGPTIVCFRGSTRTRQWILNALFRSHPWRRFRLDGDPGSAFVHSGIYVILKRVWPLLAETLERSPRPWFFTGHSLGGALAMLAGALVHPDAVYTFGAPKAASREFFKIRLGGQIRRFVNGSDLVTRLPLSPEGAASPGRELVHGIPAIRLLEGGDFGSFGDPAEENVLPFDLKKLATELEQAPPWLLDHRMGGYCRKLREAGERGILLPE